MSELTCALPPRLAHLTHRTLQVQNVLLVIACLMMATTFGCVVVLRYGFNADLFAYEEWLLVIGFWMFFIGSAIGTYENSHIKADLLGIVVTDVRLIWWRSVFVCLLELAITAAIVYWAALMLADEIAYYPNWQSTIALQIPFFVPRLGIFLGFVLMLLYSALHLYALLRNGAPDQRKDHQLIPPSTDRRGERLL